MTETDKNNISTHGGNIHNISSETTVAFPDFSLHNNKIQKPSNNLIESRFLAI